MKTTITVILFTILIIMGCDSGLDEYKIEPAEYIEDSTPDIGEVWRYESPNPFSEYPVIDYIILNVKGGYVKYANLSCKITDCSSSSSVWLFKSGSKRIK